MNMALHEDGGNVGVESDSKQHCSQVERLLAQHPRRVSNGEGMKVDNSVEHVSVVLPRDPVHQRTEMVS